MDSPRSDSAATYELAQRDAYVHVSFAGGHGSTPSSRCSVASKS